MNLYLISQEVNDDYDTYDAAVVAAESEDEARLIHPADGSGGIATFRDGEWCKSEFVIVRFLGIADPSVSPGVVLASYNAG